MDTTASNNECMPECLAGFEQAYYISARGLYQQYAAGHITLEQARQEKALALKKYQDGKREWNYFMEIHALQEKLVELKKQGFNSVSEWEILETLDKMLHDI
ncbi:MAG: hypothetical protein K0Q65_440 [Clostridia bacterium]|nr:hypothetical protein [Clostridia bacterium]